MDTSTETPSTGIPAKKPTRWALLTIAAVVAALSVMAVPAGAQILPGTQTAPGEPLYTVEVHGFTAIDESGYDLTGSDEIFGIFRSNRGDRVRTSTYGDVDTGEFRRIGDGERCLAPQHLLSSVGSPVPGWLWAPYESWDCRPSAGGVPGPINLILELWEDDPYCGAALGCSNPYAPAVIDPADDLIQRILLSYSRGRLESQLRHSGELLVDKFTFGGACGSPEPGCVTNPASATGPEYKLTINIRRVNDPLEHAP
jgi:hypothetical protein